MMRSDDGPPMNENTSIWLQLGADANGDGRVSLADVESLIFEILLLPGDALVFFLVNYAPSIANSLDISVSDSPTFFSITASIVIWLAAIIVIGSIFSKLLEIDRKLTAWIAGRYREFLRQTRILRRRIVTAIAPKDLRSENDDQGFVVDTVELANIETAVLRCLSNLDDGAVLTIEELTVRIDRPKRELTTAISRLTELEFVKPGTDRYAKRDGHRIGTAGQMYLLGA